MTAAEQSGSGQMTVRGELSLHGLTRPVRVSVRRENGRYVGTCEFNQREFGITPVSITGGTVKVKDELKIEFDIHTTAQSGSTR